MITLSTKLNRFIWYGALVYGAFACLLIVTVATTRAYTAPAEPQTRIESDRKTGAILFIVNGREEAPINTTGLHVRHHIDYGGAITDEGAASYDKRASAK